MKADARRMVWVEDKGELEKEEQEAGNRWVS